jgi:hypothetical protein
MAAGIVTTQIVIADFPLRVCDDGRLCSYDLGFILSRQAPPTTTSSRGCSCSEPAAMNHRRRGARWRAGDLVIKQRGRTLAGQKIEIELKPSTAVTSPAGAVRHRMVAGRHVSCPILVNIGEGKIYALASLLALAGGVSGRSTSGSAAVRAPSQRLGRARLNDAGRSFVLARDLDNPITSTAARRESPALHDSIPTTAHRSRASRGRQLLECE